MLGTTLLAEEPVYIFEDDIVPLIDTYCIDCHESIKPKGDLDLLQYESHDMVLDSFAIWQRIGQRLEKREMPPKDEDNQPTDEERKLLVDWIKGLKFDDGDCSRLASEATLSWYPGYVMSRRLNRHEYENTIRDLLGIDINVAHLFPADGAGGEGFDTNGNALFLSAIQIEKYLETADLVIETALPALEKQRHPFPRRNRALAARQIPSRKSRNSDPVRDNLIPVEPGLAFNYQEAAREVIGDFASRAWRRPLESRELDRLMTQFDRAYDRGDKYAASLKLAFKAALISPHFIFLAEPAPNIEGEYPLGQYQMAARLSYFLWATMPDDELFALAEEGLLQDEGILREQVARMLKDPKAKALGDLFATQWLSIAQLGEITKPDSTLFPQFDDALAQTMRREVSYVFTRIIQENRSLLELIDADYTYANEKLAAIYGLEGVTGEELQLVEFDDPNRGGVMSMAAVLTTTSHPLRTSPVLRGKWVLEQLLGDHISPPPPNVGELPENEEHGEATSLRKRLEIHRANPECASCHNRMDPIGFGLENFDPIGRWRMEESGQAIDAAGVLPSGESFSGPVELKAILMVRKDAFARNLSKKMLGYALGRAITRYDQCVVNDALEALQGNEYKPSALITEIVLSHPFRYRYGSIHAEEEPI